MSNEEAENYEMMKQETTIFFRFALNYFSLVLCPLH